MYNYVVLREPVPQPVILEIFNGGSSEDDISITDFEIDVKKGDN